MTYLAAIAVGGVYASGIYLILQRSIIRLILGLALLGHAANLLIFSAAGLKRAEPPLIAEGARTLGGDAADPVPQALILTAIVIGFAVLAFAAVLVKRAFELIGSDDGDRMRTTDQ